MRVLTNLFQIVLLVVRCIYPGLPRLLKVKYGNGTTYTRNLKTLKIRKTVEPS